MRRITIPGLGFVAEHIGGPDQDLLEGPGGEFVPHCGFGKRVSHVGQHGHVKMGAAAVFQGEKTAPVQVGADNAVFGQSKTVAAVGLGDVPGGGVGEMDESGVPDIIQNGLAVVPG